MDNLRPYREPLSSEIGSKKLEVVVSESYFVYEFGITTLSACKSIIIVTYLLETTVHFCPIWKLGNEPCIARNHKLRPECDGSKVMV